MEANRRMAADRAAGRVAVPAGGRSADLRDSAAAAGEDVQNVCCVCLSKEADSVYTACGCEACGTVQAWEHCARCPQTIADAITAIRCYSNSVSEAKWQPASDAETCSNTSLSANAALCNAPMHLAFKCFRAQHWISSVEL